MTRPSRLYDALAETGDEAEPLDYISPVTCADNKLNLFNYPTNVILLCHKLNFHLVNFRLGNFKVDAVALGVRVPSLRRRRRDIRFVMCAENDLGLHFLLTCIELVLAITSLQLVLATTKNDF